MKVRINFDPDGVYGYGSGRLLEATELVNDFIECLNEVEDADEIRFLKDSQIEKAVDFVAESWNLDYDFVETPMNTKLHATAKHKDGVLAVDVDVDEATVAWAFLSGRNRDADVFSSGEMDIELYLDNTWLPYEESHRPTRFIPKSLIEPVYKLFKKCGMRENAE